nr:NBS-LRR protein [Tanacetum cinerariifolium]
DPASVAANFNVQDYATLVAHPSPFWKFPEQFLCLVRLSCHYTLDEETYLLFLDKDEEDMDIFAFIHTSDPTKVKVVERERKEDEPRLLETTVSRTVPLLPVALDRGESELDTGVDKLFDEGGSGAQTEQGDSAGGGAKASKEKENHCCLCWGEPIPTIPFVTSSISAMPKREDEGHTNSVTGRNLRTISAPQRTDPAMVGLTDLTGSDFLVGGIHTIINPDSNLQNTYVPQRNVTNGSRLDDGGFCHEMVDEFAIPNVEVRMRAEYNIREKRRLKSVVEEKNQLLKARDEEIENLKARLLLKESKAAEDIRLRTEAFELETAEKSLRDEVTASNERNTILKISVMLWM